MSKAVSETERALLREEIGFNEERMKELAQIIAEEAGKRYTAYNRLVNELRISGENHLLAREALAEVLIYVSPRWGLRKTINFFGLFKNTNKKKKKRYNGPARKALERLTITIHNINPKAKLQKKLLRQIWLTVRRETQERLADIPAQQQG